MCSYLKKATSDNKSLYVMPTAKNYLYFFVHRTAPFNIDEMGKMHVTILRSDGEVELIRIHVMMEVATVFIVLNKEEGRWPYRIDNKSSWDISFCQHVRINV